MDFSAPVQEVASRTPSLPAARVQMFFVVVLTAAIAFLGGVWFAKAMDSPHNDDDFEVFWQSWDILERDYYFEIPPKTDLIYGAAQGLLTSTGDRYTFFVPPSQAELDRQRTAGEFGGIGAFVSSNSRGQVVISSLFDGFPADLAGFESGDIILEIDGVSIDGWSLDDALGLIRGDIGSVVTLTVFRPIEDLEFSAQLTRARVELPTVVADQHDNIGYVRLFSFNYRATESLQQEISQLLGNGIQGLILDLRGNPGGLLDQAVSVSDLFLDDGIVVTQRSQSSDEIQYRSTTGDVAEDIPLVVLVDGGSASASEVVAGALHDRGRATLIGETTFGKGSVQHVHDMPDGSQVHITAALWFTPNETPIEGQGLQPDVIVDSEETPQSDEDPYLEAALFFFETGE
jgi:carboxyl-terminal processing protease